MGFTAILPALVLVLGSLFPAQSFSLELLWSSPIEHHRTIRMVANAGDDDLVMSSNGCPAVKGWKENNGNCYYFSSHADDAAMVDWPMAQKACMALRGDKNEMTVVRLAELGNPNNLKSDDWLMKMISEKRQNVWLGAEDTTPGPGDDTWKWAHSERALSKDSYYWGPCQPNNEEGRAQNCLATALAPSYCSATRMYFNDADCAATCHYVCQRFMKTLPKVPETMKG